MKVSPGYIPGCLFLFNFSLPYIISDFGDRMYFPTKTQIACQMEMDPSCDGAFISRVVTTCGHQRQAERATHPCHSCCDNAGPSQNIKCRRNRDCRIKKSVCYDGVCLCEPGYYFSPRENACLPECDVYDDQMDIYKGLGIYGHNDKTLYNTTLTSCCDLCVREKALTCLTVDWKSDGQCLLSEYGYRDVLLFYRESNQHDWCFAQRRCK